MSKSPLFLKLLALLMQKVDVFTCFTSNQSLNNLCFVLQISPADALQPIPRKFMLEVENFLLNFPQTKTFYIPDVGFKLWGHGKILGILLQNLREIINEPLTVETR